MYASRQLKKESGGRDSRRIDVDGVRQRMKIKDGRKTIGALSDTLIQRVQSIATKRTNDKPVSQLMAWVITRDLNLGMSQSSNSGSSSSRAQQANNPAGSSHGSMDSSNGASLLGSSLSSAIIPTVGSDSSTASSSDAGSKHYTSAAALNTDGKNADATDIINQPVSNDLDLKTRASVFGKIFNLKFHHRHILFSKSYDLPVIGYSNNIGYGGELYSESSLNGYQKNNQITGNFIDDIILILAINNNRNFGAYRLLTNNCQHWVNKVYAEYRRIHK